MNFLAHLLTGDTTPDMMVGSLAGDFCRGRLDRHPQRLREGIRLHRAVDAFADRNVDFSAIRHRLRPAVGLYAAVGADMLIDHVLARDWTRWAGGGEMLVSFCRRSGAVLSRGAELLPAEGRRVVRSMVEGEWMTGYATLHGIRTALGRMNGRVRGGTDLRAVLDEYGREPRAFEERASRFLEGLFRDERLLGLGMRPELGPGAPGRRIET